MRVIKKIIKSIYFMILEKKRNIKIKSKYYVDFKSKFEGNNIIHKKTNISNSKIGYGTYIGEGSTFINTIVGKYCSIASNVKTIVATHPIGEIVSTHPAFFSTKGQAGFTYTNKDIFEEIKYINKEKKLSVEIGNDVWIGEDVTILGGVKIGDGAIIGTGAIVTHNVEPYSVNAGVPCRKIRDRFEKDEIDFLSKFKWWDKSEEWITKNVESFQDIKKFMKKEEFKNE